MQPGVLFAGRFRTERRAGRGGMGEVWRALDEARGVPVALKLLVDLRVEAAPRFMREARVLEELRHPGIVGYVAHGIDPGGTLWLAMEWLDGVDLSERLAEGALEIGTSVALVRRVAEALAVAHARGIVHRDVKPANVFLVDDPSGFRVKLLDFGVAKSMGLEKDLTQSGMLLGTPVYMPPEQAQGGEVDARADVYSFAAVAYEALTGRQAIEGHDLGRILIHVLNTAPPRVSSLVPGIPPEVDEAFASALAKDPARRLKDIELWGSTFADALEKAPGDPATAGWPTSRRVLADLRDSRMEREPTRRFPGAARG